MSRMKKTHEYVWLCFARMYPWTWSLSVYRPKAGYKGVLLHPTGIYIITRQIFPFYVLWVRLFCLDLICPAFVHVDGVKTPDVIKPVL